MPLTISDELLMEAGIDESDARIEIACRLFDASRLSFAHAMRWAGLSRTAFEEALLERGLAIFRPTVEDLQQDLQTLDRLGG
ncbi:MAG: UPF0175 family protein [Planctomycetes bacterium]|nr:UPF0175 family protein [Planctomycetota bacterium]MBL7040953.1 UPF0175 family protein [Pirellulaceae bacterium]